MTAEQIDHLASLTGYHGETPLTIMETHISWVLLSKEFAFKVKKPVQFSFLDFTTLALREHYCREELRLNQRMEQDIYLGVVPITEGTSGPELGGAGTLMDYAVQMKRLPDDRRMDKVLLAGGVTDDHMVALADKLVAFHQSLEVVHPQLDEQQMKGVFNDVGNIRPIVKEHLGSGAANLIDRTLNCGDRYLHYHLQLMQDRIDRGLFRNCHGDLHSRNIFLTDPPVIFDCIEFNPRLRHIDLLNEVAFFVMDLEFHGRKDLAAAFLERYFAELPLIESDEDGLLFIFYKLYRANVRAKVNGFEAMQTNDEAIRERHLATAHRYLKLMGDYLAVL